MSRTSRTSLPIDEVLDRIVSELRDSRNLVIEAPPGAGKTTRVPPRLLEIVDDGREVWVLEPRRIAARSAARRVAMELGERLGETVGCTTRFDDVGSPATRIRFVTEGILARRLLSDRSLTGIGVVVFDEFHERHIHTDVGLALARQLQLGARPDLRIVAMSATLDEGPIAEFLGSCPVVRSEGRRFEVEIAYDTRADDRPLDVRVAQAVAELAAGDLDGDVLVFLPGAREIRRALESCAPIARRAGADLLPLHGELPAAEQDRAVAASTRPRIILSTNVAESSITIEGVIAVVDSGLARVPVHSPWTGLPRIETQRISRASADQRAGRAGRLRPGRCVRLYTSQDFAARPAHTVAEIHRLDLAETMLMVRGSRSAAPSDIVWFEAPDAVAIAAADRLLERLGAIDADGALTDEGRAMLRLPVHPRLSRLVLFAASRGQGKLGCIAAAALSERDPRQRVDFDGGTRVDKAASGPSDLLALLDVLGHHSEFRHRTEGLDAGVLASIERTLWQLERALRRVGPSPSTTRATAQDAETALGMAVLAAFPDRVARRIASTKVSHDAPVQLALSGGGTAELHSVSVVRDAEFMVALDAETRRDPRGGWSSRKAGTPVVRMASRIESDWLIDLFADRVVDETECIWAANEGRVYRIRRLVYDGLVLEETRQPASACAEAGALVLAAALEEHEIVEHPSIQRLVGRLRFVARIAPDAAVASVDETDMEAALADACASLTTLAGLRAVMPNALAVAITQRAGSNASRALSRFAPERVRLGRGREVSVHYEDAAPPWIASRLQDFFGMQKTPAVGDGRQPLVIRLLGPNQRPVQVTSDLSGFWSRHYPALRRELSRRYPRHAWPEDPLA